MKLWIGNITPGTTDDEIREFLKKYAPDLECKKIQRVEGDGSRPAASIEFVDAPYGSLEKVSMRLHGMHWKGRALFVQTVHPLITIAPRGPAPALCRVDHCGRNRAHIQASTKFQAPTYKQAPSTKLQAPNLKRAFGIWRLSIGDCSNFL